MRAAAPLPRAAPNLPELRQPMSSANNAVSGAAGGSGRRHGRLSGRLGELVRAASEVRRKPPLRSAAPGAIGLRQHGARDGTGNT